MRYRRTIVTWLDAMSETAWQPAKDVGALEEIHTTGWLVKETPASITICNSYSEDGEVGDCITIPVPWIVQRETDGRNAQNDLHA